MHVALVHRDLHQVARGGICTLYLALATELVQLGHRVSLVTQHTPHPVDLPGVDVHTLTRTEDLDAHRRAVSATLKRLRPDVAECSTWEAELLHYLGTPDRAPVLVRGDLSAATMHAALVEAERAICAAADTLVAVSEFAATDLATAYQLPRPPVIANGVDRHRFQPRGPARPASGWQITVDRAGTVTHRRPLPDVLAGDPWWARYFVPKTERWRTDPPRVLWVGKFTEMKGFDRLQRVAAALNGRAQLLILLGHGQVHYPVDLPDDVQMCQDLDGHDVPALYRAADLLLSTSRWEGYGLAIAEALACATPAYLPDDLAVAGELITPGVTGMLWHSEEHLLELLTARLGMTGSLPDRYTWPVNAAATLAAYQRLLPADRERRCGS